MDIRIDPEFESLIRPLTSDEHQRLNEKLEREGCIWGLAVWTPEDGDGVPILLDGHHRYQWCVAHHIVPTLVEIPGIKDRDDAIEWIINHQLAQRNLNPYEAIELARKGEERLQIRAEARQQATQIKNGELPTVGQRVGPPEEYGKVDEIIAKKAGVSDETVRRSRVISVYGTDEEKIALRQGTMKIGPIFKLCIERRLRDVWERSGRGENQYAIGKSIQLAQSGVNLALKKAREKYGPETKTTVTPTMTPHPDEKTEEISYLPGIQRQFMIDNEEDEGQGVEDADVSLSQSHNTDTVENEDPHPEVLYIDSRFERYKRWHETFGKHIALLGGLEDNGGMSIFDQNTLDQQENILRDIGMLRDGWSKYFNELEDIMNKHLMPINGRIIHG